MHRGVVVGQIGVVGAGIHLLLYLVHAAQVVEIGRVGHRLPVWAVGEVGEDFLPPALGLRLVALPHGHEIHVVVDVEAVDVVGIAALEAHELAAGGAEVLELVLEYDSHVVESLLDDVVGGLLLLVGLRDLLEVELHVVGVVLLLEHLLLLRRDGVVGLGGALVGLPVVFRLLLELEALAVAAAPVVLELAGAPSALELRLAGVLGHGVVEIPRLVAVHLEVLLRGVARALAVLPLRLLLGEIRLAPGGLGLLLLLLDEVVDDLLAYGLLLLGGHGGEAQQGVLELHVAGVDGELVEHVAARLECLVAGIVGAQLRHGLGVAGLRLHVFMLAEVDVAEGHLGERLVDALAGRLLDGQDIVFLGLGGVLSREV